MSKRPEDSDFNQNRLPAWQPAPTINELIFYFFFVAILFIPIGYYQIDITDDVQTYSVTYADIGDVYGCNSTYGSTCSITFNLTDGLTGPVYVYYGLSNYYQNHIRYVKSLSPYQLMGQDLSYDDVATDCYPLVSNGSYLLNPCGLIANSFFNDVITLNSSTYGDDVQLDTDGISWPLDEETKFAQVDGFVSSVVYNTSQTCAEVLGDDYSDCNEYIEYSSDGNYTLYYYYYPNDDSVQYLYESFPEIITPIQGVTNEHFINWMRTAGMPEFRKYYGKIDYDFSAGDSLTFDLVLNYDTTTFHGTKTLVVTNLSTLGAKNTAIGYAFMGIGLISFFLGVLFSMKRIFAPRPLGDVRQLVWTKSD